MSKVPLYRPSHHPAPGHLSGGICYISLDKMCEDSASPTRKMAWSQTGRCRWEDMPRACFLMYSCVANTGVPRSPESAPPLGTYSIPEWRVRL